MDIKSEINEIIDYSKEEELRRKISESRNQMNIMGKFARDYRSKNPNLPRSSIKNFFWRSNLAHIGRNVSKFLGPSDPMYLETLEIEKKTIGNAILNVLIDFVESGPIRENFKESVSIRYGSHIWVNCQPEPDDNKYTEYVIKEELPMNDYNDEDNAIRMFIDHEKEEIIRILEGLKNDSITRNIEIEKNQINIDYNGVILSIIFSFGNINMLKEKIVILANRYNALARGLKSKRKTLRKRKSKRRSKNIKRY